MKTSRIAALMLVGLILPACGIGGGEGTLQPAIAPGSPTELKVFPGNGRVTISWSATSNAGDFTVLRSPNSGGPYSPISVPTQFTTPTTYVDPGLPNGTTFYYVVTARNKFGESPASEEVAATPGFTPRAISVGPSASHCLAVFSDGSVWGWGRNHRTQLGLNALFNLGNDPVEMRKLDHITSVAVGESHSLALKNDGTVWAWGSNESGQAGIGSSLISIVQDPVTVPGLTDMAAIAAGEDHSLALRIDGTVWAWGANTYGQAGDGVASPTPTLSPVQVPGLSNVIAIAAGRSHNLALRANGTVWAWGDNSLGQIGNGTSGNTVPFPEQVDNLTAVTKIACGGYHNLALRQDGAIWSWGFNGNGELGNGTSGIAPTTRPVKVINLAGMIAVGAGVAHSLAVKEDGTAWGWGTNSNGELGSGPAVVPAGTPVQVSTLTGAFSISGGNGNSLALGADGTVSTWGVNGNGELGIGALSQRGRATEVFNLTGATAVAAGYNFSAALRSDQTLWAWGSDDSGQLGNGTTLTAETYLPGRVGTLTGIISITAGYWHAAALDDNGKIWSWGRNNVGQTGNGNAGVATLASPGQVVGLTGVMSAVSSRAQHTVALRGIDGALFAWGSNSNGQLGNGSTTANPVATPVTVLNLPGPMSAVSAGGSHTLAIRGSDGTVWGWGNNTDGQLGTGTPGGNATMPVQALGLSNIIAIAAGDSHSIALRGSDNTVWVWGSNALDQLGLGPVPGGRTATPTMVPGLTAVAIAAATYHTLVLRSDGTVWAWGHNPSAQVGNGTISPVQTPIQVQGVTDAVGIAAGYGHSLVVRSSGLLQAWGDNSNQQLGTPFIQFSTVPVTVTH